MKAEAANGPGIVIVKSVIIFLSVPKYFTMFCHVTVFRLPLIDMCYTTKANDIDLVCAYLTSLLALRSMIQLALCLCVGPIAAIQ